MEINLLSNETEQALIGGILTKVGTYLERYESLENPLGIISQREATETPRGIFIPTLTTLGG